MADARTFVMPARKSHSQASNPCREKGDQTVGRRQWAQSVACSGGGRPVQGLVNLRSTC